MRRLATTCLLAAGLLLWGGCPEEETEVEPEGVALLAELEAELEAAKPRFSRRSVQQLAKKRAGPDTSLEEELADFVKNQVRVGYADREEIIEGGVDSFGYDLPEEAEDTEEKLAALEARLGALTDAELAVHAEAEKSWKTATHPDLLSRVFADLEKSGIVAREKFSCCQSCGIDEIHLEMEEQQEAGQRVEGYAFFHDQDVDYAVVDTGQLYLSYGSLSDENRAGVKVGRQVVGKLRRAGFTVEWSGTLDDRILITGLDWKKRRTTAAPED